MADMETPDGQVESQPEQEQPQAGGEAAPEVEAAPETIPYRLRDGSEIPLSASALQAIADAHPEFGGNAAAVLNKFRMADEADWMLKQAKDLYKRTRQPRPDAEYQRIEQQRQHQYQPQRQYQSPQQGDEEDPLALIRNTAQAVRALSEAFQQQQQQAYERQQAYDMREQQKLVREADREYKKFVSELEKQGWDKFKIPDRDELLEEAERLGMFYGEESVGDMYRQVHRLMDPDEYVRLAMSHNAQKAREPKAKIPVPASRPAAPAPQQGGSSIDNLPAGTLLSMLRESARPVSG